MVGRLVVGLRVGPSAARVEKRRVHVRAAQGHIHAEALVVGEGLLVQLAGEGRAHHGAGGGELHAMAHAVAAARPAGVHQVDAGMVALDALAQHLGVVQRVERHEGLAEERREGGHGLLDALLGAGDLGGEAGHEVIHGRLLGEARDGGQHAEGVGGKEDDHAGGLPHALEHGAVDVLDGVGHARVLGDARVGVVGLAGLGGDDDVLAHRAEADGAVDVGLALLGEVDALGVAAALDVEDGLVGPAVLVVADEAAGRIGRQGGLAGAGQAEEHRRAARLGVDVGGAVHREHVVLNRQQVVHRGEDGLLDLAGVPGAGHDDDAALEVDGDDGLGGRAVGGRVAAVVGRGEHHEVGRVGGELLSRGAHEHLAGEERLVGLLAHHGEVAGVRAVGAGHAAHHVGVALGQVGTDALVDVVEVLKRHGGVHLAPGDVVVHVGRVDDEAVLRGAAGVLAGGHGKRAGRGEGALVALDAGLDEVCRSHVHMDTRGVGRLKAEQGQECSVGRLRLGGVCIDGRRLRHRWYRLSFTCAWFDES